MKCREFDEFLSGGAGRNPRLTPEARAHIQSCPDCRRLAEMIDAPAPGQDQPPDPDAIARVTAQIVGSLQPVRPVASLRVFTAGLVVAWAVIAWAGAARSGFGGYLAFSGMERAVIYLTLAIFAGVAAQLFASEMVPGSGRRIGPVWLTTAVSLGMILEFALFFRNYDRSGFVPEGLACLGNGLLHAIPVGLAAWILLRRGFAVQPVSAGVAAGLLAGLGGLGLLELHCPNLKLMHRAVWHVAVVPVSGAFGGILGWLSHFLRSSLRPAEPI